MDDNQDNQSARVPARPTRLTRLKVFRNIALVILGLALLLGIAHEVAWYMPVTSYTYVLRAPKGNIIAHHSNDNATVATAIRDAFNQSAPALHQSFTERPFITCTHSPAFNPFQSFNTYTYTFSLWGIPVESVSGWVNDCPAIQVDSVLSPTIWMWTRVSIPYDAPPNPVTEDFPGFNNIGALNAGPYTLSAIAVDSAGTLGQPVTLTTQAMDIPTLGFVRTA